MRISFTFFSLFCSLIGVGQDTLTIDRLDYRFVTYEDGTLSLLTSLENSDVAGLFISCLDYEQIEFCSTNPFSVWVDGRLIAEKTNQDCLYLKLATLCRFASREDPYLTIVSEERLSGLTARSISLVSDVADLEPVLLIKDYDNAHWIFGFLAGTILLTLFQMIGTGNRWRFRRPNLKKFSKRFLTFESLVLIGVLAIINSFCYSYVVSSFDLVTLILYAFGVLLVWFVKSGLTFLSGAIFNYPRWANWQLNFELLFWLMITLIVFGVLFLDFIFFNNSKLSIDTMLYVWSISSLLFLLLVTLIFMSEKGIKNLHIFIYLCTTEILPIVLLVYWFLK